MLYLYEISYKVVKIFKRDLIHNLLDVIDLNCFENNLEKEEDFKIYEEIQVWIFKIFFC